VPEDSERNGGWRPEVGVEIGGLEEKEILEVPLFLDVFCRSTSEDKAVSTGGLDEKELCLLARKQN
jgi:hypothetical protein